MLPSIFRTQCLTFLAHPSQCIFIFNTVSVIFGANFKHHTQISPKKSINITEHIEQANTNTKLFICFTHSIHHRLFLIILCYSFILFLKITSGFFSCLIFIWTGEIIVTDFPSLLLTRAAILSGSHAVPFTITRFSSGFGSTSSTPNQIFIQYQTKVNNNNNKFLKWALMIRILIVKMEWLIKIWKNNVIWYDLINENSGNICYLIVLIWFLFVFWICTY